MLHRSFKAGKCKTSLKLAVARMKLLKNKREVQLRQMKRDLAHLLETGQEKTAMIRVEHVVREEKTMAAYDFIDIYCELIVARLPIIESQKNCPIDLKEAVSSVIFASPRCADIPELMDIRKHFTAKYGKDFVTSSLELRPDCGVNRTVVENLSARAPNGETKLKILNEIAQEHNIKWDPKAFGEKELKPPEDLLNGPRVTGETTVMPTESFVAHHPPYGQKPESSYWENVAGPSQSSYSSDPTNFTTPNMRMTASTDVRASGDAAEGREFERPSSQNAYLFKPNQQNWNMDFKDATAAAHAAAESAERAGLAARAAAEIANLGKVRKQYSTGSHESHMQDQPRYRTEKESMQGVSDSMLDSQDITRRRNDYFGSSSNHTSNIQDDIGKTDIHGQKFSSEVEAANNSWRSKKPEERDFQSSQFEVESVDQNQHIKRSGHTESVKEDITRQSSRSSSSFSDDNDDVMSVSGNDGGDSLFISTAKGSMQSGTKQPSFNNSPSVVFDESVSDDETSGPKYGLYKSSPDTNSPARHSEHLHTWSPVRHQGGLPEEQSSAHSHFITESSSPFEFSERIDKVASHSQSADLSPATFDDSDGMHSGGEEEIDNSKLMVESSNQLHQGNSFNVRPDLIQSDMSSFPEREAKLITRKPWLHSSSDESDSDDAYPKRNQEKQSNVATEPWKKNQGLGDSPNLRTSTGHTRTSVDDQAASYSSEIEEKQQPMQSRISLNQDLKTRSENVTPGSPDKVKDSITSSYLSSESGKELDLGRLRGGFRNKGYTRPPYRKGPSVDDSPLFKQQETSEQSNISSVARTKENPETMYQEASNRRLPSQVHNEMSSRNFQTNFDSEDDDAEVFPRQTDGNRGKLGDRFSRRTRDSPALSGVSSLPSSTSGSRATVASDRDEYSPKIVHATQTLPNPQTKARSSGSRRSFRTNNSVDQKPYPQIQIRHREKPDSVEHQSSKSTPLHYEKSESSRSSAMEKSPPDSGAVEILKQSSLKKDSISRESSLQKAGHVHPKLPDYDSFAAHFQSLKSSR